ncbi:hypothetical protein CO015_05145, partial [candidate division WWE3 bacterium CG_4_8_14_3_um_filter_42_11]
MLNRKFIFLSCLFLVSFFVFYPVVAEAKAVPAYKYGCQCIDDEGDPANASYQPCGYPPYPGCPCYSDGQWVTGYDCPCSNPTCDPPAGFSNCSKNSMWKPSYCNWSPYYCSDVRFTGVRNTTLYCPEDGGWTDWSACSATACGTTGTQTRTCTNPPPSDGGANCSGDSSKACSTPKCECGETCTGDSQCSSSTGKCYDN